MKKKKENNFSNFFSLFGDCFILNFIKINFEKKIFIYELCIKDLIYTKHFFADSFLFSSTYSNSIEHSNNIVTTLLLQHCCNIATWNIPCYLGIFFIFILKILGYFKVILMLTHHF